jgi:hypothetical protein
MEKILFCCGSRIFENSNICARLERREIQGILIDDNGYPLIFWGSISVREYSLCLGLSFDDKLDQ